MEVFDAVRTALAIRWREAASRHTERSRRPRSHTFWISCSSGRQKQKEPEIAFGDRASQPLWPAIRLAFGLDSNRASVSPFLKPEFGRAIYTRALSQSRVNLDFKVQIT